MSRSYKKTPVYKDRRLGSKRLASKKVRRSKDVPKKGKGYRKIYDSWNISDFKFHETWKEFLERAHERSMYRRGRRLNSKEIKTLKDQWNRWYRRK